MPHSEAFWHSTLAYNEASSSNLRLYSDTNYSHPLRFSEAQIWQLLHHRLSFFELSIAYRPAKWIPE
jgi:hypothetical protein